MFIKAHYEMIRTIKFFEYQSFQNPGKQYEIQAAIFNDIKKNN